MGKQTKSKRLTRPQFLLAVLIAVGSLIYNYYYGEGAFTLPEQTPIYGEQGVCLKELPAYSGQAYVAINGNQPFFTQADYTTQSYETYF